MEYPLVWRPAGQPDRQRHCVLRPLALDAPQDHLVNQVHIQPLKRGRNPFL